MFFTRQKNQIEDIQDKIVRACYQLEKQAENISFIDKLLTKVLNLRTISNVRERDLLLKSLDKDYIPACDVVAINDNGNITLEFSVKSTPCSLQQEPLLEDGKVVGMKYKLEYKVVEPC